MKKKGFTTVEILIASTIMCFVLFLAVTVMSFMSRVLYNGQTERSNRSSLTDNIYYISREIQSAEGIKISADQKTLYIKQRGSSDYSLVYSLSDGTPTGALYFKSKKMLDADFSQSKFEFSGKSVKITLAVYKNAIEYGQIPKVIELYITPRSESVYTEVLTS